MSKVSLRRRSLFDEEDKQGPAGGSRKDNVNEPVAVSSSLHCSCVREEHLSTLCGVLLSS